MAVRVITGEFRGRMLRSLPGNATRPMLGRVRQAVFSILADRCEGAEVWDLFAGTGANGIEALSRGAARVHFVERGARQVAVLRENLAQLGPGAEQRSEVIRGDAWQPLPESAAAPNLVFLDPPYPAVREDPHAAAERTRALVARLAPGGIVCFHFEPGCLAKTDFGRGCDVELRTWGRSTVAFVQADARAEA